MLLAVDTSTQFMGICLYDEGQVLGEMVWKTNRHHTEELAPSIDMLFYRCGVEIKDLSALAAAIGPGSFTSLRIGLSHLKGMSLALHLPMIGVPTLDVLAFAQPGSEKSLVACLQAGRNRLAYQEYDWKGRKGWQSEREPRIAFATEFEERFPDPVVICGEISEEDRELLKSVPQFELTSPAQAFRRPAFLAELAWKRFIKKDCDDPATLAPIYLHIANPSPAK
jgi:tRNA threonylcarbamoyladenosine biosynthesis protein TsaB